jgi:hypothetical protein
MADNVDEANDMAELHLSVELTKPREVCLPLTGSCYYCDAMTDDRFCDADCRDDFERNQRRTLMRKRG